MPQQSKKTYIREETYVNLIMKLIYVGQFTYSYSIGIGFVTAQITGFICDL